MPATVLRIALPLPLPRLFDYLAPGGGGAGPGDVGRRVRVPFGPRELVGVVAATGPADGAGSALREALDWLDPAPLLHGELLATAQWLARYLHAPLGEVLATALPAPLRRGEPLPDTARRGWSLTAAGVEASAGLRSGGRPRRLAEALGAGAVAEDVLDDRVEGWRTAARSLEERGLVQRVVLDGPAAATGIGPGHAPNAEQAAALDALRAAEGFAPVLLEGVTGSGKTEVYLEAIAERCLAHGRQALVLVPEIGLTPQMLARFRARLGVPVHALHSGLSDGERARTWAAAWRGEAQVVVGTRSAVFAPLPNAGLLVVDEEHDGSYKQQDGIRYHARDVALVRGRALDVPVLLGSATPSLETLHNARAGRYAHLRLRSRAGEARPPRVRVHDVRKRPLQAGLSEELLAAVRGALDGGGQVLVFKNRRGYAPVLLCHDCGWSAACARCSTPDHPVPMTVHGGGRRLQCHHCGSRRPVPMACPDCASLALQPQGVGTERIEELLAARFGDVPVLRIDSASTRRRDGLARELAKLEDGPGILVGTQMLAKGHDLPKLVLVCVVGIDEGLFSADFRASEKLAQLLVQVSGRAGRAERAGEVLLQTHHPEHPLLEVLVTGGYRAFADAELGQREAAGFPPFAHMALVRAEAQQAGQPEAFLQAAATAFNAAREALPGEPARALLVAGPVPAPMPRRAGMHRAQLLLVSPGRPALHAVLGAVVPGLYALPEARRVRWSLDVDPVDLY
ncbi:primosomal protein N' [Luteimonas sp. MC1750]|uniref:primosomal protein N' n=1 Tax=Luteimonas sp. MC1750 TaxID=2799326 RepID=UPI0018F0C29A|nr:primosomal protein N' [Luteimonas sp. MC1750]MBJ6985056.1 primosomal protein N' [Luteimonas sp. MC1750]QQO05720.1 primosomal protein N' [Luteimonas sp. MC1750]